MLLAEVAVKIKNKLKIKPNITVKFIFHGSNTMNWILSATIFLSGKTVCDFYLSLSSYAFILSKNTHLAKQILIENLQNAIISNTYYGAVCLLCSFPFFSL